MYPIINSVTKTATSHATRATLKSGVGRAKIQGSNDILPIKTQCHL